MRSVEQARRETAAQRDDRYRDIERIIELDFVRATEAAALNALPWLGRGEKEKADGAASDAIRGMFDLMNICGEVVIGEGIKDKAPGLFKGEQLGKWLPGTPRFDIAHFCDRQPEAAKVPPGDRAGSGLRKFGNVIRVVDAAIVSRSRHG